MYPLQTDKVYPRDHWYIAAFADEVSAEPFLRTIFNEPIVLFRTEAGEPVALWGLCPHRFLPLDQGRVEGDTIVCGYHGYAFDTDGKCVTIPTGGKIPSQCALRRYPVVERGPFVWIWTGDDAEAANQDRIPDLTDIGLGETVLPGWRYDHGGYLRIAARAPLLVDNLFDLSHIGYIHAQSLPGAGGMLMANPEIEDNEGRLRVSRKIGSLPVDPNGVFGRLFGPLGVRIYAESHTEMYSPAMINAAGPWAWVSDEQGGPGEPIGMLNFPHGITPETDNSLHYFYFATRNFRVDDDFLSTMMVKQMHQVVGEDLVAIEAIEQQVDRPGLAGKEISTLADTGVIQARRRLRREIEKETA